MGIHQGIGTDRRNFSSHVLKIELSGPTRSHFGILDVPGVFDLMLNGITETERAGVEQLVTAYMKESQNIVM